MSMSAPDCPRCDSSNTEENVTTDIPGDSEHDYGCNDCLFVWEESDDL